jgi:hypothetical protein
MATSIEASTLVTDAALAAGWAPETLGPVYLATERKHDRSGVLRHRTSAAWVETPDWRFHRHVMRIGLYLRGRAQLEPSDRVAFVAALGPEWAVAEWAVLTQGASTAAIDPGLSRDALASQLASLAPRVIFTDAAAIDGVVAWNGSEPRPATVVALNGPSIAGASSWSEALDLGGTLDTAERANAYRSALNAVTPDTPAIGHIMLNGEPSWRFLSQRDAARAVRQVWLRARIARGDVAYLTGGAPSLGSIVAFLAFSGDGHSQVVLGTPGREVEEIIEARPSKLVARAGAVRRILEAASAVSGSGSGSRSRRWLARARCLVSGVSGVSGGGGGERRAAANVSPMARTRWLGTEEPLDPATQALLSRIGEKPEVMAITT